MDSKRTLAGWEGLVKKNPDVAKADPVTKALEAFKNADDRDDHEARLNALRQLISKAETAKRENKTKKEVVGHLDRMLKDAESERKAAEEKVKDRQAAEGEEEEGDGEGALLKGQLKKVIRLKPENAK